MVGQFIRYKGSVGFVQDVYTGKTGKVLRVTFAKNIAYGQSDELIPDSDDVTPATAEVFKNQYRYLVRGRQKRMKEILSAN